MVAYARGSGGLNLFDYPLTKTFQCNSMELAWGKLKWVAVSLTNLLPDWSAGILPASVRSTKNPSRPEM